MFITQDGNQYKTVRKCTMNVQHQNKISPTIPKDPIIDQKINTVRKNPPQKTSFSCLSLSLQTNTPVPSATVDLLGSPFVTTILRTIHKTFTLTHPSIDKFKFVTHSAYTEIIRKF